MRRAFLILLAVCGLLEAWSFDSCAELKLVSQVQVSPDGEEVLYSVSECADGEWRSHVWLVSGGQARQFTRGAQSCHSPQWSPDGKKIAFLSGRDGSSDIYVMERSGGEAYRVTRHGSDIQGFIWGPDSARLAFVATQPMEKDPVCVVADNVPVNHLYLSTLDGKVEQLTSEYRVCGDRYIGAASQDLSFSPDGSCVAFGYQLEPGDDDIYVKEQIAIVDVKTKEVKEVGGRTGCETSPRFSPDGKWLAYLQSDVPTTYACSRYVAVMDRTSGEVRALAKTPNEGPGLGDAGIAGWSKDSKEVYVSEPAKTLMQVYALSLDGSAARPVLDTGKLAFVGGINGGGTHFGLTVQDPTHPGEVGIADVRTGKVVQLTQHNQAIELAANTEVLRWKSGDGEQIEGLVTYPTNYQKGSRYPCIVVVHGGPMGSFFNGFAGNWHPYPTGAFAQEGFVVLRPNPRGSTGYGREFRNKCYEDWGGGDFEDVMSGIDALIAQGVVDPDRLGICGWSYGGYMSAWAITQTDRFKAASMGAGISNTVSLAGTTDIPNYMEDYFGGDFPEKMQEYLARSPITHVRNAKTPCLIQHGSADIRVPLSQSEEFYRALKRQGVETQLVIYPGMGHGIGAPDQELDCRRRNVEWFKKHLM